MKPYKFRNLIVIIILVTNSNYRISLSQWLDPINVEINGFACEAYKNTFLIAGRYIYRYRISELGYNLETLYKDDSYFTGLSEISDSVIIAVGLSGKVIKTVNSGSNWVNINPGTSENLKDCYFFDINRGFVIGNNSYIKKTADGGVSWKGVTFPFNYYLEDIIFTNDSIGFIGCGGDYVGDPLGWTWDYGHIYKTNNSGLSWEQRLYANTIITSINFPTEKIGYAVTVEGDAYKSTDYGENWTNIINSDTNAYGFKSVKFLNDTVGFIAGIDWRSGDCKYSPIILRTVDGGRSWTVDYNECLPGVDIQDIAFSGNKGIAVTYNYIIPYNLISNNTSKYLSDNFKVYPNPTNNILNFSNNSIKYPYIMLIYNYLGKIILEKRFSKFNGSTLDISNFEKGLYILIIKDENYSFSKKIIKY